MVSPSNLFSLALLYICILFAVAWWADRRSYRDTVQEGRWYSSPGVRGVVYALSLAVYCSSWTFYGAVGSARATRSYVGLASAVFSVNALAGFASGPGVSSSVACEDGASFDSSATLTASGSSSGRGGRIARRPILPCRSMCSTRGSSIVSRRQRCWMF